MDKISDKALLTEKIKAAALALGFQKVGVIPAGPLEPEGGLLEAWLSRGHQAEMTWMVNHLEKRKNPATLMEGAQSIVCVAMNYYSPEWKDRPPDAVKIAKYAQGTDYHYVVKDRLKDLLREIQSWAPAITGRAFTDSAPLLEKPMAVRAGLGWMGKNGNLLTQDYGSWLFLGELLLNIELAYDTPSPASHCGTCTRCIDACPTQAITEPAVVDANRCISYWTIEHKGESIPEEIAQKLEGWVFGCDICQDVCPWNLRFARETAEPLLRPRPWNQAPDASELLSLSEEDFRERYRKSPVKRAKLSGLKRNVTAAWKYLDTQSPE